MPCAHACRRALFTAAVILRLLRSPPAAISFSARHAVGTDATGPNSSRWSPITRKSLITRAPSAIAHARSDEDAAPVMAAQRRRQRRRQPGRQARPVRQLPQQDKPRVRHDARAAAGDFKTT